MIDNFLLHSIVDILAYPFELFVHILDNLDLTTFFIGGIVIAVSTRFILKPIFGGKAFNVGSDSARKKKE